MPFWTWSSLQARKRWLACGMPDMDTSYVDMLDGGGVGESSPTGEADASDIINTCASWMLATRAHYLLLKASTNHNKVQCGCMFWDWFPFQKQYLFHPFPGRSDPSTSAHRVSQGQYQERPAVCSLTIGKRCGRLVSEVVAQSKPNQPGRYIPSYISVGCGH